ncbi:uncharacterized protein BDR25DRAFT_349045 [Lindgomyces ingoldianus]|uniref:Uncharacterized protein n=1 Tax=Lindgomyces ingoldianus TaxID=673940 RepID=A0ACB6RDG6_9PLEO|nr:uncharacterized protein BDR25DRAFT_349045 [Lindgomyces ingoldianus]KAF2477152.1 hypothetical protein BDR25DRAFT_349045 [Lindgomyces ingoldianus]
MGKPANFETMEQTMRDNFNCIRIRCEARLVQQVDRLETMIEGMEGKNDILQVESAQNAPRLGNYRLKADQTSLKSYRQFLEAKFDKDRHRQNLGVQEFLETPMGKRWQSAGSVVIVLSGCNERGIVTFDESWLSPVARIVAFGKCDDEKSTPFLNHISTTLKESSSYGQERIPIGTPLYIANLQAEPLFVILNRMELGKMVSERSLIEAMLHFEREARSCSLINVDYEAESGQSRP